jgi:hypothetical protein
VWSHGFEIERGKEVVLFSRLAWPPVVLRVSSFDTSNRNLLHFVERDLIAGPVVKLGGLWAFVVGDLLGMLDGAVFERGGNAGWRRLLRRGLQAEQAGSGNAGIRFPFPPHFTYSARTQQ